MTTNAKPKALQTVRLYLWATSYTACMFASFMRPGTQGPNFKWENFPDIVAESASRNVMISMKVSKSTEKASKEIVREISLKVAKKLVDEAGLI